MQPQNRRVLFYENLVSLWGWVWGCCYQLYAPSIQRFWALTATCQDLLLISFIYSLPHDCFWHRMAHTWHEQPMCKTEHSWNTSVPCENTGKDTTENRRGMAILYKLWEGGEEPKHNKRNLSDGKSQVGKVCKPVCGISPMGYWWPSSRLTESLGNPSCAGSLPSLLDPSLVALVPGLLRWLFTQLIQPIKVTEDISNQISVEICHFLPFYSSSSAHTDIGYAVEPPKGGCRTAGPWWVAVPWISTPPSTKDLPIVVCNGYMVKYFTLFWTQTHQWHLY